MIKRFLLLFFIIFTTTIYSQLEFNFIVKNLENLNSEEEKITYLYNSLLDKKFNNKHESLLLEYINKSQINKQWNEALRFTNTILNHYIYSNSNLKKGDSLAAAFYPNLKNCTHSKDIGKFYTAYIETKIYNQEQQKALNLLVNKAIPFFEKENDSSSYDFAYAYLKAGETSSALGKMTKSIFYFNKAEKVFTQQKDTLFLLWTYNGLSSLYSDNGLFQEAAKKRTLIYSLAPKIGQEQVAAMAHIKAAMDAQFLEQPKEALDHIKAALKNNYKNSDIKEIVETLTLAFAVSTYAQNNKTTISNDYLKKLDFKMKHQKGNPFLMSYYQTAQAYNAYYKKKYKLAEKITLGIREKMDPKKGNDRLVEVERLLFKIYEKLGKKKLAFKHYKNFTKHKNRLNKEHSKKKFAFAQTLYETNKKIEKIKTQQANISLIKQKSRERKKNIVWIFISIIGFFLTLFFYISRRFIKSKQLQQEEYTHNLLISQEEERKRIGRDLHDSIGQNLMLLKRKASKSKNVKLENLASSTLEEMRTITKALHPSILEKLGLTSTIINLINEFDKNSSIFFTQEIENIDNLISKENEVHLFRIVQEAITNLENHSKSKVGFIIIKKESQNIILQIIDKGIGFEKDKKSIFMHSLGMKTLQERSGILNAIFHIKSSIDKGTTLEFIIPIK
ncbi:MAG: histidine kinase [Flavobacteriaceae bacterium]